MTDEQITQPFETRSEKILTAMMIAVAIIVAFWFRFNLIDIKPFHFDEGVNYNFLHNLATTGEYRYDPTNYHGPTLYYLALITLRIFGEDTFALRFWPAIFGVLTVSMLWFLRHHLGKVGTPIAAFCMALSPGLVYYSRDFIHEMSFGCFTLGIVTGALRYVETRKFTWLVLMSVSAALLIATKETSIVNIAVLILAIICASVWVIARRLIREDRLNLAAVVKELKGDIAGVLPTTDQSLAALVIFAFIYILFYSSLFTHSEGVIDFFRSIWHWTSERSNKDHVKPFSYYLGILIKLEFPLLIGSLLGGVFVVRQGTRFWLFIAAWTLGAFLAYSIIPYKTPWLMISFLIPMAIISGYAAQEIYQSLTTLSSKLACAAVVIIVLISCWRLSWSVNFEKYDDNDNTAGYFTGLGKSMNLKPYVDGISGGYVYVQTYRDILNLVAAVKSESERLKSGNKTGILLALASGDYWPLPWYLRNYRLDYQGRLDASPGQKLAITQPLVITTVNQQYFFDGNPEWRLVDRAFKLRPGVDLVLYAKQEIIESPQKAQNDGNHKKDGDR
jgi:uncharacterized protein (TIGR03663 family)